MQKQQMGWDDLRNSIPFKQIKKNLANPYGDFQEQAIDEQIIQSNVRKSFVYQMAKKKLKHNEQKPNKQNKIFKTRIRQTKVPLTVSKLFSKSKTITYEMQVYNVGKKTQSTLSLCSESCDIKNTSTLSECTLSQSYQLQIRMKTTESLKNQKQNLLFYLNFNTVNGQIHQQQQFQDQQHFLLKINQSLILKFKNKHESQLSKFRVHLKTIIENSQSRKYGLQSLSNTELKFWNSYYKSAVDFTEQCQTGDIILFRGSHLFGSLQRLLTNSQYDHVGMMIKDPTYGNLIFQSTSNSGVCLASWDQMLRDGLYQYTEEFVWRKLTGINRDYQFKSLIHSFVTANLRKKYFISLQKLAMNTSVISRNPAAQNLENDEGFFCSELVAKTYKNLDLLTRDQKNPEYKASNNFYPYHFTDKFGLKLMKGQLSQQYKLWFDAKQIEQYLK